MLQKKEIKKTLAKYEYTSKLLNSAERERKDILSI